MGRSPYNHFLWDLNRRSSMIQYQSALIVEPDESRSSLMREVLSGSGQVSRSELSTDVCTAKQALARTSFDLIFISHLLTEEDLLDFHDSLLEQKWSSSCTVMLLTPTTQQKRTDLLTRIVGKAHGILCEPFSVETLRESLIVAEQVRAQEEKKRSAGLIEVALVDAMTYIDAKSMLLNKGFDKIYSPGAVKKLQTTLQSLFRQYPELFLNTVVESFSALAQKSIIPRPTSYTGVSKRVKEKMQKKLKESLLDSLEKEDQEQKS